jgi:ABC-type multidrug transport system fused ATPase/permease subunit
MSKLRTLWKALKISITVQGIPTLIIRLFGFAAAFLPVIAARQLQALTDTIQALSQKGGSPRPSLYIMLCIAGLFIAQIIISAIEGYAGYLGSMKIRRYINRTILKHKCEARYKYIDNYDDFHKRLAFINEYSGNQIASSINNIITILQLILSFAAAAFTLWKINPFIVLILIATSVPAAILSYIQQDQTFRGRTKWIEEGSLAVHYYNMIGAAGYSYDGLQEIRHYGLFDYLKARWRSIANEYLSKKNKLMAKHIKYNTAADFLRSAVYLVILLMTAWSIYANPAIGLGTFTLVYTLSGQLQNTTGSCFVLIMLMAQSIPYMQEFFYFDNIEREPKVNVTDESLKGNIEFQNVTFTYPNTDRAVLTDINVCIKEGEKIAVVGENGSGKSTFINLLCGMYDPTAGNIKLGGTDIKSNLAAVRKAISVVFQDFAHYETSLRENITISDSDRTVTDDEIMALLSKINVDDVVNEQKHGLDEVVGSFSEKANNLSGGQWQKISIARAAYRNKAKIMILDEPTAALDPIAETQLYRNFASLTEDKTTILISHRLGIASIVDRILVFKDGKIVEDGSHKELMEINGHYAQMYNAQAQWYA